MVITMKKYRVLRQIASRDGGQIWRAGDTIELDDDKASLLASRGAIESKPIKASGVKVARSAEPETPGK